MHRFINRSRVSTRWRVLGGTVATVTFAISGQLGAPLAAHADTMAGDLVAGTTYYTQVCPGGASQAGDTCIDVITITVIPQVPTLPTVPRCLPVQKYCPPPPPTAPSDAQWYNVDIGADHYSGCYGGNCSTHDYHVEQKSSDWFDATSAGNNWVDGSNCVGYGPWWCNAKSWGSFWDQQMGASTDWSDWDLRESVNGYQQQDNEYGRFWLYPGGHYEVYVGH